eukprot:15142656-Alexandrium_andersonii.AAC.1
MSSPSTGGPFTNHRTPPVHPLQLWPLMARWRAAPPPRVPTGVVPLAAVPRGAGSWAGRQSPVLPGISLA